MKEKEIEAQIIHYLWAKKIHCWKNDTNGVFDPKIGAFRRKNRYAINGSSDVLGVLPGGRFLAIEVKTPKGKPTKAQLEFITRINEQGGLAFIARSLTEVVENLKEYL